MAANATGSTILNKRHLIIVVLVAVVFLVAVWLFYIGRQTTDAPTGSTTESQPNSSQNVPPSSDGSVRQDGVEADPTTPSSSGTGANNLMSEEQGGVGAQ